MKRLSTGSRINSSMDDAAGSAISLHLSNRISGSDIAQNNIQMASSMLNVALGALDNISDIFLRLRDLSLESLNGTYSDEERKVLQDEAECLTEEIYRIKSSTKFNSKQVLGVDTNTITIESEAVAQGYTVVKTAQQLKDALKTNDSDCKVMLFSDINLDDLGVNETGSNWTAVGTSGTNNHFKGIFDGNGFSVSNLKINRPDENYQGFFGITNGATIKNVTLDNVEVTGKNYTGGLVGYNYNNSIIENCTSSGNVTGNSYTGGLVGENYNDSTIENCTSSGNVTGYYCTGGLIGHNFSNSKISNCSSSATVKGDSDYTGGLVGANKEALIENCSAFGMVTGNTSTGGLVGYNHINATIENCTSSGNVTGNGRTGGLVGYNYDNSIIKNSNSLGNVIGNDLYTGGLVGTNHINSTIENCSSSATVSGNSYTGGLIGVNHTNSTINNCSSSATVTGNGNNIGGLVGRNQVNSTINNCFSSANVTGNNITGGLVGQNYNNSSIYNSISSAYVTGNTYTGGLAGSNIYYSTINNSSSSGTVKSNGNNTGGLAGENYNNAMINNCTSIGNISGQSYTGGLIGYNGANSTVQNSSTTSKVSGTNYTGAFLGIYGNGELSGNEHNSTINEGMEIVGTGLSNPTEEQIKDNQDLVIEENSIDLSGIGANLDLKKIGANLDNIGNIGNSGGSTDTKVTIQVGYDAGDDNTIDADTGFYLGKFNINISTEFGAKKALDRIDEVLSRILDKKSELGAKLNRLDNAMYNQTVSKVSLMSQNSLIKDTDVAKESCNLIQHQILQEISTSLFTVNRQSPNIALKLLNLA